MKLEQLRAKINQLDSKLLNLLNERTRLVTAVGALKRAEGLAVFAPGREHALLQWLEKRNRGPLDTFSLRSIYREIFSTSRAQQNRLKIGYMATGKSPGFRAARSRFGACDSYVKAESWRSLESRLRGGSLDVAVICATDLFKGGVPVSLGKSLYVSEVLRSKRNDFIHASYLISPCPPPSPQGLRTLVTLETAKGMTRSQVTGLLRESVPAKDFTLFPVKAAGGVTWLAEFTLQKNVWKPLLQKTLRLRVLGTYPEALFYAGE